MLQTVDIGKRSIKAYRGIAPDETLDQLVRDAEALRGARVLHLNATPYGGGVSELLRSMVPLLNDLGLIADWKVISGDDEFFGVTKKIHNGLQGAAEGLTNAERESYQRTSEYNAKLLQEDYDFVFIHDPQPAAILPFHGKGDARWVWRCHIDTSEPNPEVWSFLRAYLSEYDAAVFTMDEFTPPDFPVQRVEIMPPAIDPLSPKNLELPEETARQILDWIGVPLSNPLITQISRFDPWKDPLGVIQAYRLAREEIPNLGLVLAGSMALDDPEGWDIYRKIMDEASKDPLIHVFTNLTGVGNIEVNAFQRLSNVMVQKSIREGFGLVVSEALWKGSPIVAGRAGGIPLQMANGLAQLLVDDVEDTARTIVDLLNDPEQSARLGRAGRERVRERFLLPRLLLNEINLMIDLVRERPIERDRLLPPGAQRDPVCGMVMTEEVPVLTATHDGVTYRFCSEFCQRRFLAMPERYIASHP